MPIKLLEDIVQPIVLFGLIAGELYVIWDVYKKDKKDMEYYKKDYLDLIRRAGM